MKLNLRVFSVFMRFDWWNRDELLEVGGRDVKRGLMEPVRSAEPTRLLVSVGFKGPIFTCSSFVCLRRVNSASAELGSSNRSLRGSAACLHLVNHSQVACEVT